MLAANEAVASHLENTGLPSIYRIHEKPDPKRVMEFEEVATHFGYSLGIGAIPVKRFGMTDRHRDGTKRGARLRWRVPISTSHRAITSGWWRRSKASPRSAS